MIQITDKSKCCGCQACFNICPTQAITMIEDKEGFKYPVVDKTKCINCGLCEKVCPYFNEYKNKEIFEQSKAYGGWNKNQNERERSTSGGIFTSIAKYILEQNGLVCGAIYDENFDVVHDIVDNIDDLKKINGSKYVQSDIRNNLKKIKEYLDEGRMVLFSGTPCQVSGLNSFLGKEYDNLYTCDIVCHGVPSPKVWRKYKNDLEKNNKSKITDINFRNKISGWQGYSFSAKFENNMEYVEKSNQNEYMRAFLSDIDLRRSCPSCKFAKLPRYTDFTLGDFWGVDNSYPELNKDNKGTSLILVHTKKGEKLLLELNDIYITECELNKSISENSSIYKHNPANSKREDFLNELDSSNNLKELVDKYIQKPNVFKRIFFRIKKIIKKMIVKK